MHPSQKTLLKQAEDLSARMAATVLWKYSDPDTGKVFYLTEKVTTIRSPWTGKTFTTRPERSSLSEVGFELREEAKVEKTAALDPAPTVGGEEAVVAALEELLAAARTAKAAAESGNTKRMFFRLLGVVNQLGVVGRAYDLPDVGFLMRVYKSFASMAGARPSTNFSANAK